MKQRAILSAMLMVPLLMCGAKKQPEQSVAERYHRAQLSMPLIFTGYFAPEKSLDEICLPEMPMRIGISVAVPDSVGELTTEEVVTAEMPRILDKRWLDDERRFSYIVGRTRAYNMLGNPGGVSGVYAALYKAPQLVEAPQQSLEQAIEQIDLPLPADDTAEIVVIEPKRQNWIHVFNVGVQFSQAYISPNWYQGGNNHLSLVGDFLWDVKLNQVYHPNLMFQNTISYKLVMNSSPQDEYHKYNIAEDIFQWNLKFGVKAFNKWFYSLTAQFKTQFFNNYEINSLVRKASFLSPGDLNVGLGMTYATTNKSKSLKFNVSLAPLSYNLKSCIDSAVDPVQFGLNPGQKWRSEIGSNGELTLEWAMASNINYKSRLFLFSDYSYFLGDWENTMSFSLTKFLSTQLYWRLRYDTSRPSYGKWGHWMLKEILSFGFSYNFK